MPLASIPSGLAIHNIELQPGRGAKLVRSAGLAATISAKEGHYAHIILPSGEVRKVHLRCRATIGQVSNIEHASVSLGKAGRHRWLGFRPHPRGVAQNPVSHPMGGGEGKTSGGRHPCSPWGKLSKGGKTRCRRKPTSGMIIRRRQKGQRG
jgi:large subunit ribosomal protein L2